MSTYPIGENRAQIMGCGTIGVLIVHSTEFMPFSNRVAALISYFGLSVYLFSFLSGIGLTYSMGRGVKHFYKRRVQRVLLPYLVIGGVWYGLEYLTHGDIVGFFYELSTLSFWFEHKGAWYVAMLIPLYCLYPALYSINERYIYWVTDGILCMAFVILLMGLAKLKPEVYSHIGKIINSYIVFLLGDFYVRRLNRKGYKVKFDILFASMLIVLFLSFKTSSLRSIAKSLLAVGVTILLALVIKQVCNKKIQNVLEIVGKNSLELYLLNIFMIKAAKLWRLPLVWWTYIFIVCIEIGVIIIWRYGNKRFEL